MKFKIFFISLVFIILPLNTNAQTSIPFGGMILTTYPCTCTANIWYLLIKDAFTNTSLPIVFEWGVSRLNQNYMLNTKLNTVGSYTPGATCLMYAGTSCYTVPVYGFVTPPTGPGVGVSSE